MGKTGRTKTNRKKKNRNFTSCTTNNVVQTTVLIMSNQSMNVSKFTIICALFRPIVYMNALTTRGFCTDSLKAKITPQINHLICKVRKNKCSVQTVHSFEQFFVILYKTTSEHEINTSQFDDNSLLIFFDDNSLLIFILLN